ncbi:MULTISPECIES: 4-carboxy-4-hydroxy-2-oxoadipate aldolase/oxaloacetate decarboxylase [unclassified Shinella]|uniref:4-carboxy-4-hydroxy-2-oxoadipate aldolase/oxaloacetate decarboxylase n=1 Tax=unclassified Shinella TaxID=2643062 RepID=UPI00225DB50B|nr:4-carboxy-4-hydroxy-2-oxoadipate aldolase/oxaloacetate decarboxylase [Shinella sp. YE25]MDC7258831.1 4-carboxy-4-hydroxy-2-oxoadipate aldolase/oxaloacetate decarboxylase [Shinella sp. YE25]CAI0334393.1 putative 4-hydroxy-4-methyl-2-oxoglutarate aldolase/4-carboxy-4-hydroxy-2-oxoadipate aldolase [Rhizobiaceae bacterium]CAK7260575.1 4-hydroxy-4-methyl-2-oxoglutarate aldolase [Shinella sp. WSC3-e]
MYGHIYHDFQRAPSGLIDRFKGVPTSTLSDAMGRHGAMKADIRPIFENIALVGSAFTVLCFPGDNIMTHKAVQMMQPGDVLVIDAGDSESGCFGHRSALQVRGRGGVGVVASGTVRDVALLRRDRFPVFSRGVSPRAPQKNTPGSINVPVEVGGVIVSPGDIVVGDDDGIAVVPRLLAEQVLARALQRERAEALSMENGTLNELLPDPAHGALDIDRLLKGTVSEHAKWASPNEPGV